MSVKVLAGNPGSAMFVAAGRDFELNKKRKEEREERKGYGDMERDK